MKLNIFNFLKAKCPVCRTNLVKTKHQSVEVLYCLNCQGIWLDKGKLDQIININQPGYNPQDIAPQSPFQGSDYDSEAHHGHDGSYGPRS